MINNTRPEPATLQRLRQAVQQSGLTASRVAIEEQDNLLLVNNRLARTTLRYLTEIDLQVGEMLAVELQTLSSREGYELLMLDRSYTFLHVVQFLFEFAKHYSTVAGDGHFCYGVGHGGGGLEVAPDLEVLSLVRLLTTAMPQVADRSHVGVLMQCLGPLVLKGIFSARLFDFEILAVGEDRLRITLNYVDRAMLQELLGEFGLTEDAGTFFFNAALHIQGTLQLGWETLVLEPAAHLEMGPQIESRSPVEQERVAETCHCEWTVTWNPGVRLNRLGKVGEILERGSAIYEALHRRELRYYLERINHLEVQLLALQERSRLREMEQELQTAHDLQMRLMGQERPRVRGFDIAGRCLPANHVAGDFFKFYRISRTRLAGVLADVAGHSMEAAVPLLIFNGIFENQLRAGDPLEEFVDQLNRSLCRTLTGRTFVCFVMAELDPNARTLRITSGGCPYPYLYRAASGEVVEIQFDAYPLGVRPDTVYRVIELQLEQGDQVVLCSDGIIEAANSAGELFGFERTAETVRQGGAAGLSAEEVVEHIVREVKTFSLGVPQADDQTLVVLKVTD